MDQNQQTGAEQAQPAQPEILPLAADPLAEGPGAAPEPQPPLEGQPEHRALFGIQSFFTVVVFSIFVITFVVQAFQIPSGSMENTLLVGDFLLVDKLHFAGAAADRLLPYSEIKRGDIIVFYYPVDPSQFLVKRVIGLPGDHVRLRNRLVYVNGIQLQERYVVHRSWIPDA